MKFAYLDSSVMVATLLGDGSSAMLSRFWGSAERFISSYLLQAEVLAAGHREDLDIALVISEIRKLGFIRTDDLTQELKHVFAHGYVRGADAFHLATALWVRDRYSGLSFLTFDDRQRTVAEKLNFICDPE